MVAGLKSSVPQAQPSTYIVAQQMWICMRKGWFREYSRDEGRMWKMACDICDGTGRLHERDRCTYCNGGLNISKDSGQYSFKGQYKIMTGEY